MAASISPSSNDGGIILVLFLMAIAIALAYFTAVIFYENHTNDDEDPARLLRLLVGCANIGNGVVHVVLVIYIIANKENTSEYWIEERKLGGIEGPAFLIALNFLAGFVATEGHPMLFPIIWNCFVVAAGTFVPMVWPRFLEEGLAAWPHIIVFIWFCIFTMELTAFAASVSYLVLGNKLKID